MKRCDPEGAVGRRQSEIQRLKASATSGPMAAALTRQTVYLDHLLSTLDPILAGVEPKRQPSRSAPRPVRSAGGCPCLSVSMTNRLPGRRCRLRRPFLTLPGRIEGMEQEGSDQAHAKPPPAQHPGPWRFDVRLDAEDLGHGRGSPVSP